MFLSRLFFIIADDILLLPLAHCLPISSSLLIDRAFFPPDLNTFLPLYYQHFVFLTCRNLASHLQTSFPYVDVNPIPVFLLLGIAHTSSISAAHCAPIPQALAFCPSLFSIALVVTYSRKHSCSQEVTAVVEVLLYIYTMRIYILYILRGFSFILLFYVYDWNKRFWERRKKEQRNGGFMIIKFKRLLLSLMWHNHALR